MVQSRTDLRATPLSSQAAYHASMRTRLPRLQSCARPRARWCSCGPSVPRTMLCWQPWRQPWRAAAWQRRSLGPATAPSGLQWRPALGGTEPSPTALQVLSCRDVLVHVTAHLQPFWGFGVSEVVDWGVGAGLRSSIPTDMIWFLSCMRAMQCIRKNLVRNGVFVMHL